MDVGLGLIFQGTDPARSDLEVYRNELCLGRLAEPLGFQSIWDVEHHFTSYTMCPDVLQYLTYFAGCTERIALGSMVVVLPWHEPLRSLRLFAREVRPRLQAIAPAAVPSLAGRVAASA